MMTMSNQKNTLEISHLPILDVYKRQGLTQWCFGQAGVSLPRTAQEQYEAVQHLELEEAQPGDLVDVYKRQR